jgi:hypothetical protein
MKRITILGLWLFFFVLAVWTVPAGAEGFPVKNLPAVGKSLADFVPPGWTVQEQASEDLNGDGVPDIAAILVQGKSDGSRSEDEDELQRALIVLLGRGKDKFTLAGVNDKLLQCKGCGGVKESDGISIKKGIIVVEQMSGSREFAIETCRFRYDPQSQRFAIIGRDLETGDGMRGTGTIESFNNLTGRKITENYHYDKTGEHKITTSSKKEDGPRKTLFIEDVESSY